MNISTHTEQNVSYFKRRLHCDLNFDIVSREISICGRPCCLFFVDGFAKDAVVEKIMEFFYSIDKQEYMADAETFSRCCVPYCEVALEQDADKVTTAILSGTLLLFVEGFEKAVAIDTRTYPQRDTSEPDKDKTFRGSRDGFVETLILNTALIRRRIRDDRLCVEHFAVGSQSRTDVAMCYLKGESDEALLEKIRTRLQTARVSALTMNQESLAEVLIRKKWYNPFPKFKFTERPDTTAAQLLEGDVVLLVDNSPSAMILPTSIFDIMEEANDYYFPPITGTYLRLTRFAVTFLTVVLTPTWLLLLQHPEWVPGWLSFILVDTPNIPIIWQLLLLEFAVDGLKLATLNTPGMLTTALSMLGAVIVGDFAVKSGWFVPETMLYMALVAIANYSQPEYELGYALKFMRLLLLICTAVGSLWGYVAGHAAILLILGLNRTISGKSYLYPLIPFNYRDFKKKVLRIRIDS